MNALGATLLIFSASALLFALCTALLGLDLRRGLQLSRLLSLEILDHLRRAKGRERLSSRWKRWLSTRCFVPAQFFCLRFLGLPSPKLSTRLCALALHANFLILSLSLLLLLLLLLRGDLSNRYVVSHSSLDLSVFFRATALWAGSSGSLLFWFWLLSLFCALCVHQSRRLPSAQRPVLFLILTAAQLGFVSLSLFFRDAQPFRVYPIEMQSGRGINPLLLHWAMIIHPPILYIGYVSSVIPFALLMSHTIALNKQKSAMLLLLRHWSIFSWFFLGTGILLGSKWAYEELGWGGYWAWDPVENASLMPWLVFTAFLHSLIIQERRGLLRFWNVFLVFLAYHMCLLGTWITRSGVLEGPHSFAESSIGKPMIFFIALSALYFLRFLYFARRKLRPLDAIESLTSKEGTFLLNNFLMLLAMLIILLGLFSPLLPIDCSFETEGFRCYRVEWKQGAYNRFMIPLGLFALFLMGAAPRLPWTRSALRTWKKKLLLPLLFGSLGGSAFGLSYGLLFTRLSGVDLGIWGSAFISELMAIITVGISIFAISAILQEYIQGVRLRRLRYRESRMRAFWHLLLGNKRRYGGYLVHLAIVFLFLGYAGSAFKKSRKVEFHYYRMPWKPKSKVIHYYSGDSAYIENYRIQARELFLAPVFQPHADTKKPIHFTISHEAHYHVQKGKGSPIPKPNSTDTEEDPYLKAHQPVSWRKRLLKLLTGYVLDGRMRTERHFYPQIDPLSGKVLRKPQRQAIHTATSKPDIRSTWSEDLYIQLGALSAPRLPPASNQKKALGKDFLQKRPAQDQDKAFPRPPLNHFYESYYFIFEKDQRAYRELFPPSLRASLEIWINPMVKFIWLGSLLFFFAGLLILLPFPLGEKNSNTRKDAA